MAKGVVIMYVTDIQKIFPHYQSYMGAWRRYKKILQKAGKKSPQRLTLQDVATHEGLQLSELQSMLG